MQKLSSFLVEKRYIFLIVTLVLAVVFAALMPIVEINSDLTKYLSDSSSMRKGLDIMNEEFPPMDMPNTMRVMFVGLEENQKADVLKTLKTLDKVTSVAYDDSESYNKDEYTLYILSMDCAYDSSEEKELKRQINNTFSGLEVYCHNDNTGIGDFPVVVLLIAMALLVVILLVMCGSWFEPVLFLAVIGIAVLINLGSNIIMGSISNVTFSIAAILQLVLSMDYSIILMNRYRQERKLNDDKVEAMKVAVANSVSSICSSAFTTIVGLLMLLFMTFKIGVDLGVVLAKGVLISMICVFTVLPSFIILCDKIILKTEKKGRFLRKARGESGEKRSVAGTLADFSYKARYVLVGVFVALFVGVSVLQTFTPIKYNLDTEDPIKDVFAVSNPLVLVYSTADEQEVAKIGAKVKTDEKVTLVASYGETLGKQFKAPELIGGVAEIVGLMGSLGMDAAELDFGNLPFNIDIDIEDVISDDLIRFVYYYGRNGESRELTFAEYAEALDGLANTPMLAAVLDAKGKRAISSIRAYGETDGADYGAEQIIEKAKELVGSAITDETLELAALYGSATRYYDESYTASIDELFGWIHDKMLNDARFDKAINTVFRSMITSFKTTLDGGKEMLCGEKYSRLVINTVYPAESKETTAFLDELYGACDNLNGEYYLIGSSAMNYEMANSFDKELILITVLTVLAIFLVVLFTFRNVLIPVILALLVQAGVFVMVSVQIAGGVFYLALLIVECILMGATIDYGILFTNFYRENRKTQSVKDALKSAYGGAMHTILTSGSILVLITGIIGITSSDPTMSQICIAVSVGSLAATLLILFILPGLLAVFDKLVMKTVPIEKLLKKKAKSAECAQTAEAALEAEALATEPDEHGAETDPDGENR